MRFALIAIAAALLPIAACTPPAATTTAIETRALEEGEIRVDGMVTQVEDGGYPQFTVHITPDGGGEALSLYLNSEGADLGGANAGDFVDHRTAILYTAGEEASLHDLRQNGRSLIPGAGADVSHLDSITGALSGAEADSMGGDLPAVITITDAAGRAVDFEYYITPELLPANGQQVTAYYATSTRERITYMRSPDVVPPPAP